MHAQIAEARAQTERLMGALDAVGLGLDDLRVLPRYAWPAVLVVAHREWVVSMARLIRRLGVQEGIVDVDSAPRLVQLRLTQDAYRMIGF